MSVDVRTQLRDYAQQVDVDQTPLSYDEIMTVRVQQPVRPLRPEWVDAEPVSSARRVWIVALAAVIVLLLIGGVAWLARSGSELEPVDEPTTTTLLSPLPEPSAGLLGPGSWSVAATFPDGAASPELLTSTGIEVRTWPGVLEVVEVANASAWLELTGLDPSGCARGEVSPPCGVGVVAVVATPQMALTQVRLESELGMAAITATDVPSAFFDGYVTAARRNAAPQLEFDAASLGTELSLEGPDGAVGEGGLCATPFDCLVSVRVAEGPLVVQAGVLRFAEDAGNVFHTLEVEVLGQGGHGGVGVEVNDLLVDGSGRGGVLTNLDDAAGDRAIYVLAGLPVDAAAVAVELGDGTPVWQRPLGGMILIVDQPGTTIEGADIEARATNRFTVFDAAGAEIIHVEGTTDGSIVTDLRIDPAQAGELQATAVDAIAPVDVETMTLTWSQAKWDDVVLDLVATESGFLGTDEQGQLWRSQVGVAWEPDTSIPDLTDLSLVGAGSHVLISGWRSGPGTPALLRSEDGENWTEIDVTVLDITEPLTLRASTPSGLARLHTRGAASGTDVVAIIEGDRLVDTHVPPWDTGNCCAPVELVELAGAVVAYQYDFNQPQSSFAWRYLGGGEWSQPIEVPISSYHAQVDDTVLMFDHRNVECCGDPIPGLSTWPLLASSDGTSWTELSTIEAEDVFGLQMNAGDSFWVYGPIGGGGSSIETDPTTTLWISRDGRTWTPVDLAFAGESFVRVVGDTIFLVPRDFDSATIYWVGTLSKQ